eukprot:COSAG02_NODE_7462_length_3001_cov_1.468987_2_plen_158_part_00
MCILPDHKITLSWPRRRSRRRRRPHGQNDGTPHARVRRPNRPRSQAVSLTVRGRTAGLQGLETVEDGSMLFTRRVLQASAVTPYAARLAAARPTVQSLAFAARPAVQITARQSGLLAVAGTAVSVGSGAVALAESKGWPGTPFAMSTCSTCCTWPQS